MSVTSDQSWTTQLDQALACGLTGVILSLNTSDRILESEADAVPLNLKYWLARKYQQSGFQVGCYSLSSGFQELKEPGSDRETSREFRQLGKGRNETGAALQQLTGLLRNPEAKTVIILDYFGHLAPSFGQGTAAGMTPDQLIQLEILHAWSLDDDIRQAGNFVIMIDYQNSFNSLIEHQGGFRNIRIDLPDRDTRHRFVAFLTGIANGQSTGIGTIAPDFPLEEMVHATNGLRLVDIEELFRQAGAAGTGITRHHVKEKKKQTINDLCGGLLEVAEPGSGFAAVAGSYHAKGYFQAIQPMWEQGLDSLPQAVLLSGVPGAGKSFLIKAIAREFDCPCLVMRGIREMWVGQSERNLDRVLEVVDSLAPCLLWTDEIDQTIGGKRSAGSSGDSGTSDRMLGRLLEFFGDSRIRGRVLWIATTNRPDLLDVAIKDRFSIKIPFLHPSRRERAELFPILAAQVGRTLTSDVDCHTFAARNELEILTIRAMQEIVVWAGTLADMGSKSAGTAISAHHLDRAILDYKPTFDHREHELIGLISLQITSFSSLLPWMVMNEPFNPGSADWPHYIDEMVDSKTGRIDISRLEERIQELGQLQSRRG